MSRGLIPALVVDFCFLAVAIFTLLWPEKIQELSLSEHGWFFYNPWKGWCSSRYYVWSLRITGVLSLVCAAVISKSIYRMLTGG